MNPNIALLSFANLLEVAQLCALSESYEKQEELVACCRKMKRAFLASMPVRHRFRCPVCAVETGEVELHFEDPKQAPVDSKSLGMWGSPIGRHFSVEFSALHGMLSHGQEMPAEFEMLLRSVVP